jgi:hypothetical protein
MISESGFKMLFSLMTLIGLIGIGVFTMLVSDNEGIQNAGMVITIGGGVMLCIATFIIVLSSTEEREREQKNSYSLRLAISSIVQI